MPVSQPQIPGMFDHSSNRDKQGCHGALTALMNDGLFIGQSKEFFKFLRDLAEDADEARRESDNDRCEFRLRSWPFTPEEPMEKR